MSWLVTRGKATLTGVKSASAISEHRASALGSSRQGSGWSRPRQNKSRMERLDSSEVVVMASRTRIWQSGRENLASREARCYGPVRISAAKSLWGSVLTYAF